MPGESAQATMNYIFRGCISVVPDEKKPLGCSWDPSYKDLLLQQLGDTGPMVMTLGDVEGQYCACEDSNCNDLILPLPMDEDVSPATTAPPPPPPPEVQTKATDAKDETDDKDKSNETDKSDDTDKSDENDGNNAATLASVSLPSLLALLAVIFVTEK